MTGANFTPVLVRLGRTVRGGHPPKPSDNDAMIRQFVKGETAVFIDSANIYFSQKTLRWKIDFKKLLIYF